MFFDEFTQSQLASWPLARGNYERLRNVIYRTIDFEGISFTMIAADYLNFVPMITMF